jgi:hypothetical protein
MDAAALLVKAVAPLLELLVDVPAGAAHHRLL